MINDLLLLIILADFPIFNLFHFTSYFSLLVLKMGRLLLAGPFAFEKTLAEHYKRFCDVLSIIPSLFHNQTIFTV